MHSFNNLEARIIGVLIEKEVTTPDQYPLTLNSLTTACNQKTNRDPVTDYEESIIQDGLDQLIKRGLAMESRLGGRVPKFKHRFCNTEFSELTLTRQELGILCVLLLRGPQTPGELRTRTNRLCDFKDSSEVESVLNSLGERTPALVEILRIEPGRREARYRQLFTHLNEETAIQTENVTESLNTANQNRKLDYEERMTELENKINSLENDLSEIKEKIGDLLV